MSVVTVTAAKESVKYDKVMAIELTDNGWVIIQRVSSRHIFPARDVLRIDQREEI